MQNTKNMGLFSQYSSENIKNLGIKCLKIGEGVKVKKKIVNFVRFSNKSNKNQQLNLKKNESYYSFFWDNLNIEADVKSFSIEDSVPCAFIYFKKKSTQSTKLEILRLMREDQVASITTPIHEQINPYLDYMDTIHMIKPAIANAVKLYKIGVGLSLRRTVRNVSKQIYFSAKLAEVEGANAKVTYPLKTFKITIPALRQNIVAAMVGLRTVRFKTYYNAAVYRDYYRELGRRKGYPDTELTKKTMIFSYISKSNKKTTAKKYLIEQTQRHPISQFKQLKKYLNTTISSDRFEKWKTFTKKVNYYKSFYKIVWRYFKLKIERFFYKQLGIRMHVWFMNIWDIFMTGIDSYWQWFKFEDQKVFAMTRKGQRYLIEKREEAKFYLRSMVLTLTFGGGVRLYIDKVTVLLKQYRNNWAFITHTMESLRLCGNFFWFRFFLNYKVTLQGKIGGMLRAEKKTFKKGNVRIEDRSAIIAYHRTFPRTKFGVYCLGFWLQYRVPNLIGNFNEMEFIDTMRVLLSMYTIPWLSSRLTEIIEAILREKEIRDQLRFNQYVRRQKARGILANEFKVFLQKNKSKLKK